MYVKYIKNAIINTLPVCFIIPISLFSIHVHISIYVFSMLLHHNSFFHAFDIAIFILPYPIVITKLKWLFITLFIHLIRQIHFIIWYNKYLKFRRFPYEFKSIFRAYLGCNNKCLGRRENTAYFTHYI